ncbi:MAG: type III pantothenate kinase [Cytophagales bacterium]|nr:type III pantothenate kinase [Cytophagales bacterium]MDW8384990.1 type III pantothenate kinase [Flammeovirgaceae bacterium]
MKNKTLAKQAAIDIGNTSVKIGIFQEDSLIKYYEHIKLEEVSEILQQDQIQIAIVSNVSNPILEYIHQWKKIANVVELSSQMNLPFKVQYLTPATLGTDRIAVVAGAKKLFPASDCLCIDVGTCLTFDFVTRDNHYLGGSISPGLRLRLRAMHEHTSALPLVVELQKVPLIGNSTVTCMLSGAIHGILAEITGLAQQYSKLYPGVKILLTGGDAGFLVSDLPPSFYFNPKLLLIGLNAILKLNT